MGRGAGRGAGDKGASAAAKAAAAKAAAAKAAAAEKKALKQTAVEDVEAAGFPEQKPEALVFSSQSGWATFSLSHGVACWSGESRATGAGALRARPGSSQTPHRLTLDHRHEVRVLWSQFQGADS